SAARRVDERWIGRVIDPSGCSMRTPGCRGDLDRRQAFLRHRIGIRAGLRDAPEVIMSDGGEDHKVSTITIELPEDVVAPSPSPDETHRGRARRRLILNFRYRPA